MRSRHDESVLQEEVLEVQLQSRKSSVNVMRVMCILCLMSYRKIGCIRDTQHNWAGRRGECGVGEQ